MNEPAFTLTLADVVSDPLQAFARARTYGALVDTDFGPIVVRHEAVRALLQDSRLRPSFPRFLEQMGVSSGPFYEWMSRSPLNMDGEEHRRWRSLMTRVFTPKSVERLRPFLKRESERLVASFKERGRCEFMAEFARQLPSLGLCELIGVPKEDRARFCAWADSIGLGFNLVLLPERIDEIDDALVKLRAYASELIALRRAEPRDDFVSRLARAADEIGELSDDYVNGALAGLVFAGHETTKNQLGWMMVVLSDAPEEWTRLAREPARIKDVIEEVLRLRSAATSVARVTNEPLELFGRPIAAGTHLVASLWSANRDCAEFASPDVFDVDANKSGVQLAFGQGAHHCLGAALARAELQEALSVLSSELGCPVLEPGATFLPPVGITGPLTLPISFRARAG